MSVVVPPFHTTGLASFHFDLQAGLWLCALLHAHGVALHHGHMPQQAALGLKPACPTAFLVHECHMALTAALVVLIAWRLLIWPHMGSGCDQLIADRNF
jgi:hypothetical protein